MTTQRPGRAERLFFVLAIVFLAEAVIPLLLHGAEVDVVLAPEGEPVLQVVSYGIYLVTVALFVRRLGSLLPLLARNWLLLAIALLAILSSLWSLDPALTLRRGAALLATTLFGIYLAARFPPPELLRLLGV